jgi:hypothetical protein
MIPPIVVPCRTSVRCITALLLVQIQVSGESNDAMTRKLLGQAGAGTTLRRVRTGKKTSLVVRRGVVIGSTLGNGSSDCVVRPRSAILCQQGHYTATRGKQGHPRRSVNFLPFATCRHGPRRKDDDVTRVSKCSNEVKSRLPCGHLRHTQCR